MTSGTIILLNGCNSSGKTSIARALQQQSRELVLNVGIDLFLEQALPQAYVGQERAAAGLSFVPLPGSEPVRIQMVFGPEGERAISALHHTVALLAGRGHHVVVDHILQEQHWLAECVTLWQAFPVLFAGVRCSWEAIEQHVRSRADRPPASIPLQLGIARWQFNRAHAHSAGLYDLEVDTTQASPAACALAVERRQREADALTAFRRLAGVLGSAGAAG